MNRENLLWLLFVVAVSLLCAEGVARLVLDDPIRDRNLIGMVDPDGDGRQLTPTRSYTSAAGIPIHINELGFRTRKAGQTIPPASPRRIRIAVLGDSETFCEALAYDDCFPGRLEFALAERYPGVSFEVLSFGIPATNTTDHLRWLHGIVIPLQPDIVLLNYVMNDIELFDQTTIVDLRHAYDRIFLIRYLRYQRFVKRTMQLQREKARVYGVWLATHSKQVWGDYFASLYRDPALWDAMRATLQGLRDASEAAGAAFVMTTPATLAGVDDFRFDHYRYREPLAKLRSLVADGIRFIDPLPAYVAAGRPASDYAVSDTDLHHNALGNRLLVEHLIASPEFREILEPLVAAHR